MKAPQFERPDAARLRAMAAGASASMGGNNIDTMTFGPPGSKGGFGGGFGSWGKGSSGSRYVLSRQFWLADFTSFKCEQDSHLQ